jgi:hypothetical protein
MRILKEFGHPIQLLVHGGAVMILHPTLANSTTRRTTRDVDFIKRSFISEMQRYGVFDGETRLQSCIDATAERFRMGTDWFNAHADIALPMAQEYAPIALHLHRSACLLMPIDISSSAKGQPYDPIYCDSLQPNNVALNTVYTSPGLTLISVTMFWGVALKMVRYQKGSRLKTLREIFDAETSVIYLNRGSSRHTCDAEARNKIEWGTVDPRGA